MPGKVVSQEEWLQARLSLLAKEQAHTKQALELTRLRASMPMIKITKPYIFTGPNGPVSLLDMFAGKQQLILQHIMFDPSWDATCRGCSFTLDEMPRHLEHLHGLDTMYVAVGRAPYAQIHAFCKMRMRWPIPFYSSNGSDFNYDFDVTLDEAVKPVRYNYASKAELESQGLGYHTEGEQPGISVFWRDGEDVFLTYSMFARPVDLGMTFWLLDLTPLGRQVADPALPYHDTYEKEDEGRGDEGGSCH